MSDMTLGGFCHIRPQTFSVLIYKYQRFVPQVKCHNLVHCRGIGYDTQILALQYTEIIYEWRHVVY